MVTGNCGNTVVDLRAARERRLAGHLAVDLEDRHVIVDVDEVDDVSDWRAAARAAGRARGWWVRTGVSPYGRVWACREDLKPSQAWLAAEAALVRRCLESICREPHRRP